MEERGGGGNCLHILPKDTEKHLGTMYKSPMVHLNAMSVKAINYMKINSNLNHT